MSRENRKIAGQWLWALSLLLALAPVQPAAAAPGKRVPSEVETREFVQTLCHQLSTHDFNPFLNAIDANALIERALAGLEGAQAVSEQDRKALGAEYLGSLKPVLSSFANFEYTRYHVQKGEAQALVRLVTRDGDFNYWHLTVAYTGTAQPRVVDINPLSAGENASETIHRNLTLALADRNRSLLDKFTGESSEFAKHKDTWRAYMEAAQRKDHAKAEEYYRKLPATLRAQKIVQLLHMQDVAATNPKELGAEVERFRKLFPGDPSLAYLEFNGAAASHNYPAALVHLDELEKELGEDIFFNFQRALIYTLAKQPDKALQFARAAIPQYRSYNYAGRFYLLLLVGQKQHAEAVKLLREIERDSEVEMYSQIRATPSFSQFFQSAEFKQWMQSPVKRRVDPAIMPRFDNVASTPARPAPNAAKNGPAAPKEPPAPFVLKGILFSKKNPSALINSKTVFVGDKVGEAVVVKIEEASVTLEIKGKTEVLTMK